MLLGFLLVSLSTLTNAAISNCATPAQPSLFTIDSLSQTPSDTIIAGQNMTLNLLYTSPTMVTGGSVTTSTTYNFLPLTPTVTDLCDSIECPLNPGQHDGSTTYPFPVGVSGTLSIKIVWSNIDSLQLLCLKSTIKAI